MAFSNGVFSRIYSWVSDANNGIPITASRMDAETDGIATGLSTCLLKDGTQTVTANIPMSGFKFTGVGNATAGNQFITASQLQSGGVTYCGTSGGTANAQTITPSPTITTYVAGQEFSFLPVLTNTSGVVTIANSGLTARNVKKSIGGAKVILAIGDIIISIPALIFDDGTDYILMNPQTHTHGADVASATTTVLDSITGDIIDITGTTAITAITLAEGRECTVRFTGILTLTNGASLVLPGALNITTSVGDFAVFRGYASGVVRCVTYIPATKLIAFGGQILFPSTQVPSSDPNTLDDYEEGTWVPSLGGNTTYTAQTGTYTKIGRMVYLQGELNITSIGTGSASTISGNPFTPAQLSTGSVLWGTSNTSATYISCYAASSSIVMIGTTAAAASITDPLSVFKNATHVYFSVTYST